CRRSIKGYCWTFNPRFDQIIINNHIGDGSNLRQTKVNLIRIYLFYYLQNQFILSNE
ncbi:MAG: hypothetical protein EZS28_030552, partial [Streblomastix strix]